MRSGGKTLRVHLSISALLAVAMAIPRVAVAIHPLSPPPNDTCVGATLLFCDNEEREFQIDTSATPSTTQNCGYPNPDLWYKFLVRVPPGQPTQVIVTLTPPTPGEEVYYLAVYWNFCNDLREISCGQETKAPITSDFYLNYEDYGENVLIYVLVAWEFGPCGVQPFTLQAYCSNVYPPTPTPTPTVTPTCIAPDFSTATPPPTPPANAPNMKYVETMWDSVGSRWRLLPRTVPGADPAIAPIYGMHPDFDS